MFPFYDGGTATQRLQKSEFEKKIFLLPPLYSWGRLGLAISTNVLGMQRRDKKNQYSFLKGSLPLGLHCLSADVFTWFYGSKRSNKEHFPVRLKLDLLSSCIVPRALLCSRRYTKQRH